MSDVAVQAALEALYTCLCGAVQEHPTPPQHCCYRIGSEVAFDADLYTDLCCEGLAYVLLGDMWPSSNSFPEMDQVRQANSRCRIDAWAVELRMGIVRCAPAGTETTMPTCDNWAAAAATNRLDAWVLRRAACCFREAIPTIALLDGFSVVVGRQVQGSIQGGCAERYVTVQVQVPNCDC